MSRGQLSTRVCGLLGIDVPIVQHALGCVARAPLAAAISEAGGLGLVGTGHLTVEELRAELALADRLTSRPFGAAILYSSMTDAPAEASELADAVSAQLEVVIASQASALLIGLHGPVDLARRARAAGLRVLMMAASAREAAELADHVDVIVAKGWEGSGTAGSVATSVLVPAVRDAVSLPVLASGGIADGRGLAAALALGADGVCVGTRFVASLEAFAHPAYKDRLVALDDEGTVVSRAHSGQPARLVRNSFTEYWDGHEAEIAEYPVQMIAVGAPASRRARIEGDMDNGSAPSGQEAGLIHALAPAGSIVAEMAEQATAAIERLHATEPGLVDAFYAAHNAGDAAAVGALYHADGTHREMAQDTMRRGADEIARGLQTFLTAFPDAHWDPTLRCAGEDSAMVAYELTGTLRERLGPFAPAGQRLVLAGVHVLRMRDGQILSCEDYWDAATFQRQLAEAGR